jgi:hypothetical protein
MPAKPLTKRERSFAYKYRRIAKVQEKASALYDLADRLTFDISRKSKGQVVRISETKGIQAIDQMQAAIAHPKRKPDEMPKGWAHAAFRQFKIEEVSIALEP